MNVRLKMLLAKEFGSCFYTFQNYVPQVSVMTPKVGWVANEKSKWFCLALQDLCSATTTHPQLFATIHYSPREPWDQKPPYSLAIPNWLYQQGIWKFDGLEIIIWNSIIWDSVDFFLPFWSTPLFIRSQNPSHCPPGANYEHFSSLRDRPRKTKSMSNSIPHLLLSLEFQFHVWKIILSLTLGISRKRELPSREWPCLLGLNRLP